jgi:hypothetical protein
MEPNRDDQLIADLQALRPTPRPQFAAELDERAAAGFPRRSAAGRLEQLRAWLGSLSVRQILVPTGGLAALVIAVVTAALVLGQGEGGSSGERFAARPEGGARYLDGAGKVHPLSREVKPSLRASATAESSAGAAAEEASGTALEAEAPAERMPVNKDFNSSLTLGAHHRAVERSAQITLAADPKDVADDASEVFKAVHAHNGIVMRSSTEEGRAGEAGATFELLIPSARLDDAMAAFSEIDAVRSRHEATADITAPTVTTGELLQDSKARIDSLLAQLEETETESEREAVEAELRQERRHRAALRARFQHLERRADYSRVSLRIETGGESASSGGGAWGIDDALGDAGHVLTVAAAVTLIALAVLGPIALIALLAWLTHRAWVRRERRRVLS